MKYAGLSSVWDGVWKGHWYGEDSLRERRAESKISAITSLFSRDELANFRYVADLGCGSGIFAQKIIDQLPSCRGYYGVDFSSVAIERAKKRIQNPLITFVEADLESFAPDKQFDLILLICSLEHVRETRAIVDNLRHLLATSGQVVCIYSNKRSLFFFERKIASHFSSWPFGYQVEKTLSEITRQFPPPFHIIKYRSLHADSDRFLLGFFDRIVSIFFPQWARYLVLRIGILK